MHAIDTYLNLQNINEISLDKIVTNADESGKAVEKSLTTMKEL